MTTLKFLLLFTCSFAIACTPLPKNVTTPSTSPEIKVTKLESQKQLRPITQTETITVEGERSPVKLKLYDEVGVPFTTYIPEDFFVAESTSSEEGTGVRFYVNTTGKRDESAYIHMFFPAYTTTLEQMKKFVTGERGLIANNKWKLLVTTESPYEWAEEKIAFQQANSEQNIVGNIYIGESNGKAFYIFSYFPAEYGDGFAPREDIVLKNLRFREEI